MPNPVHLFIIFEMHFFTTGKQLLLEKFQPGNWQPTSKFFWYVLIVLIGFIQI